MILGGTGTVFFTVKHCVWQKDVLGHREHPFLWTIVAQEKFKSVLPPRYLKKQRLSGEDACSEFLLSYPEICVLLGVVTCLLPFTET